jgi:tetratricopeptide (TPR) repeat protein
MSDDSEQEWEEAAAMVDAAAAAADEHRLDEALDLARRAADRLTTLLGTDHPDAANARLTLGRILQKQQKPAQALAHLEQAATSLVACEDPDETIDDLTIAALMAHAQCLLELGRFDEASGHAEQALQRANASFGPASTQAAWALNQLGMLGKFSGRFDDAERHYSAARPIFEALFGTTSRELATLLHNLGGLEHARGDFAAGEPPARRSVEIARELLAPDDPELLAHEVAHAALLDGLERHAEAAEIYRRAVDGFTARFGREHYEVASTLHNLGSAEHALDNPDAARAHYEESIALMEKIRGLEHPDVALTQYNLAILHRDAGRTQEAKALLTTALATFRASVGDQHPNTRACADDLAGLR